jgi:hypothetical protein
MSSFLFPDCHIFRKSLLEKTRSYRGIIHNSVFFPLHRG